MSTPPGRRARQPRRRPDRFRHGVVAEPGDDGSSEAGPRGVAGRPLRLPRLDVRSSVRVDACGELPRAEDDELTTVPGWIGGRRSEGPPQDPPISADASVSTI